ncbi:hypothetical protein IAR55_004544 [Kwoniella newhampshirensis]|uniref:NmrA-like domain-containing protein n=1 Tax=Kwoniella newhampshirensis TaxID=1651941 RepID=A0AAW0Z0T8_9TREE
MSKTIVVLGSTGNQGSSLVKVAPSSIFASSKEWSTSSTPAWISPALTTPPFQADYLKAQPIRYTIINPTMFMDNFWSPPMIDCVTTVWGPKKRKLIATSDIGMVSAAAFIHPEDWVGKELDLAADDLSPKEIVEAFNDIKNRDITAEKAPQLPPHLLHMLKVSLSTCTALMSQVQDGHEFAADVADCRRLFPGLKDLRTWLATEYFG